MPTSEACRLLGELRKAQGLSVKEAANRADLDPGHLKAVEDAYPDGDSERATLAVLERVANVYGYTFMLTEEKRS